jgi:hypothetical protein
MDERFSAKQQTDAPEEPEWVREWHLALAVHNAHEAVVVGRLTPEQADAELVRSGWPPLTYRPDPTYFNAMDKPRWSLVMALAWIMWRTPEAVRDFWFNYNLGFLEWRLVRGRPPRLGPREELGIQALRVATEAGRPEPLLEELVSAKAKLLSKLLTGDIVAEGRPVGSNRPMIIPSYEWGGLNISEAFKPNSVRYIPRSSEALKAHDFVEEGYDRVVFVHPSSSASGQLHRHSQPQNREAVGSQSMTGKRLRPQLLTSWRTGVTSTC